MNHCIDCGKRVSRGRSPIRSGGISGHTRCLVCQMEHTMRHWKYQSRQAQLRALGKQMEKQHGR